MLTLPIKKKWFDMILSGEKKEEYREIKPYYDTRFANEFEYTGLRGEPWIDGMHQAIMENGSIQFIKVMFRNGYSRKSPSFVAYCGLTIREGKPEWGAEPGEEYYVLKIHEIREEKRE